MVFLGICYVVRIEAISVMYIMFVWTVLVIRKSCNHNNTALQKYMSNVNKDELTDMTDHVTADDNTSENEFSRSESLEDIWLDHSAICRIVDLANVIFSMQITTTMGYTRP